MMRTQRKVWACGLVALGLAVGGVVALRETQAQSPLAEPGAKQGTSPRQGSQTVPPQKDREAEVEALKKEIEALRQKVDALGKKQEQPAPQKIVVTTPLAKDVVLTQRYVSHIRAQRHINVSPLATGYLAEVLVKEGQAVKQDQVLFKLLPTLYKAKLDVEAADTRIAEIEYNNTKKLYDQKVVSQLEVTLSEAKLARTQAKVKLAEAELNFTIVRAPFDGIIGQLQMQQGSLVKEGSVIAILSDNSIARGYFRVPEARYLEYMANPGQEKEGPPIELVLANGSKFPQTGKIGSIEAQFDNDTGFITFRADFPNPDRLLRHGQTGTVLIHRTVKDALVIPQRATFEVRDRQYVYVVGKDDVVHQREIVIQYETDDIFVVKKGLDVNDKIVLEGVRQVRDGEKLEYELLKPEQVLVSPKRPIE